MVLQLGLLDTNLFIHPLFVRDPQAARCQALIAAIERGDAEGWIDITVVHELTYALRRVPGFSDRAMIHDYIIRILAMPQILADDKAALIAGLARWATAGVGFVDAWLAALAEQRSLPICSVNRRDYPASLDNTFATAKLDLEEECA